MRKVAVGVVILVLLLGAGWTALWSYAAGQAGERLDGWLKAEAGHGRIWTCPNRAIGGYPVAIKVTCTAPTFAGKALDQRVEATAAGLTAEAALTHPQSLAIQLLAPLTYKTSDGQADLKATWSSLAIDLNGLPNPASLSLSGRDIAVDGAFGAAGRQGGKAAALDATFAMDRQTPDDPKLDFDIAVKQAPLQAIDDLLGGQTPADIALAGQITGADAGDARTPTEAIDHWRENGGTLVLDSSKISRAESSVAGSGTLALDEAHRPRGRIDASFVGLEPVLKRFGISGNVASAGALLNSLFGGGGAKPQPQGDPNALNLPISLQDGRLGVGPIRTQVAVPPLY